MNELWKKFGQILRQLRCIMSLELKLGISRERLTLTLTFFSYVFFSFTFSSALLPPYSRCLLLAFACCRFYSHQFSCISCGAVFSSHWFSFASVLFIGFAKVRLAPFSASFTFVWCAQAYWLSRLNAWFNTLASSLCKRLVILYDSLKIVRNLFLIQIFYQHLDLLYISW